MCARILVFLIALSGLAPLAWAQPANDDFANAEELAGESGSAGGNNTGATFQQFEPNHANRTGGASVWYKWTAQADAVMIFDTTVSGFMNRLLAVYTGDSLSDLTPVGSHASFFDPAPHQVRFNAVAGTEYHIAVDGYNFGFGTGPSMGPFNLNWQTVPPPDNDNLADAQLIEDESGTVTGTNVAATFESFEGAMLHAGQFGGASVWYRWTAPTSTPITFNTMGSDFDTLLAVYTGDMDDPSSLVPVAANKGPGASRVVFNAEEGTEYFLAVDGFDEGMFPAQGVINLNWRVAAPPANDNLADAEQIASEFGEVTGSNVDATFEVGLEETEEGQPLLLHGGEYGGASIWYKWTALATVTTVFDTSGSDFDTLLAIYTNDLSGNLVQVAADSRAGSSQTGFDAVAGVEYYIVVDGFDSGDTPAQGNVILRWNQVFGGLLSAGRFTLARQNVIVSEEETTGPIHASLSVPTDFGARVAVTRLDGHAGRVMVDYLVTNAWYTNVYRTNMFGTNEFTTNILNGVTTFEHVFSTNVFITNSYQWLSQGFYRVCDETIRYVIEGTNVNGTLAMTTNMIDEPFNYPCQNPPVISTSSVPTFSLLLTTSPTNTIPAEGTNLVIVVKNDYYELLLTNVNRLNPLPTTGTNLVVVGRDENYDLLLVNVGETMPTEGTNLVVVARDGAGNLSFRIFDPDGLVAVDLTEADLPNMTAEIDALRGALAPLWGQATVLDSQKQPRIEDVVAIVGYEYPLRLHFRIFDFNNVAAVDISEADLLALSPTNALAIELLKARLDPLWDQAVIPDDERELVIADVWSIVDYEHTLQLRFRIFDEFEQMVIDLAETALPGMQAEIDALKARLEPFWNAAAIPPLVEQSIIADVMNIVSYTRNVTVQVTQIFCNSQVIPAVVPAATEFEFNDEAGQFFFDYTSVSGTLIFDDYQMRKDLPLIPVFPRDGGHYNRALQVILSNPRLVAYTNAAGEVISESPEILPPDLGPIAVGTIEIQDLDIAGCQRSVTNVFNWVRANYRATEGNKNVHVVAWRGGIIEGGGTVHYRIDWAGPSNPNENNFFDRLQPGSDYARPGDADRNPFGASADHHTPPDFVSVTGTLTWNENTPRGITVPLPLWDDDIVEFNEDFLLQLYVNPGQPEIPGQTANSVLTILFDENDQPAGAVDLNHNPDFSYDTVPPQNSAPGANGDVFALVVQPDQKTVVGGAFRAFNTIARNRIARMNQNGSLDTTFDPGTGANGFVAALAMLPQGRIAVGGAFTAMNGFSRRGIAVLNANGSVDTNFQPGLGVNGIVWSAAAQSDGKILIAGNFSSVNGTNRNHVARLNPDGSLDTEFDPGAGPDATVFVVAAAPDGKVLIGGDFHEVSGGSRPRIARLNEDGTLDESFDPDGGADDIVYTLAVDSLGRVVIGGAFTVFDIADRRGVARLNSDGSVDPTFDPGSGTDDAVYSVSLQSDGRIIIGGIFKDYNQTRRVGIARLLPSGYLDTTFMDTAYNQFAGIITPFHNPEINPRNYVFATAVDSTGVLIGGSFRRVGGGGTRDAIRNRSNVARLVGGETPGPGHIGLLYDEYTADETGNQQDRFGRDVNRLYISMSRDNGHLGQVEVTVMPQSLDAGPGIAVPDVDFSGSPTNAIWELTWGRTLTWMVSDGLSGPNFRTVNVMGDPFQRLSPFDADDAYIDIIDNNELDGDRVAEVVLTRPKGTDIFFLGNDSNYNYKFFTAFPEFSSWPGTTRIGENIPLGVALGRSRAPLWILDDDFQPGVLGFAATNFFVNEYEANALITVVRTDGSDGTVQVRYSTANGTATAGSDYVARTGTLIFPAGITSQTFTIPIINDSIVEPDETVKLRLFNATGGAVIDTVRTNAVLTIIDDDFLPGRLNFTEPVFTVAENGGAVVVSVSRRGGSIGHLSVELITRDGTAIEGVHYQGTTHVLEWVSGDTSTRTLAIPIFDNELVDGDKTFELELRNASLAGALDGAQPTATVLIEDDDAFGTVRFSTDRYFVSERAGNAIITVIRVGGVAETISLAFSTKTGMATEGVDYQPTSGVLSFGPGEVIKTFVVPIHDNADQDPTPYERWIPLELSGITPAAADPGNPALTQAILQIVDDESLNESAGSVDTELDPDAGANDVILAMALDRDEKLLIGGDFSRGNKVVRSRLARLDPEGSLDRQFLSALGGANDAVRSLAIQTAGPQNTHPGAGRILVGGFFTQINGTNRSYVARLHYNGTVDRAFDPGTGPNNRIYSVAETFVNGARKILIAGAFVAVDEQPRPGIARLNDDGSLDTTFHPGTGANGTVYAMAVQADGRILIGGDFDEVGGVARRNIARLNADGSLDTVFNPGDGFNDAVRAIAVQFDGRVVVGGSFTSVDGVSRSRIARLNASGGVDVSFDPGEGANDGVLALALQHDGKILAGGQFTRFDGVTRNHVTRLDFDGNVDPDINFGEGANSYVASILIQEDGKLVLGGGFTTWNGVPRPHLVRLHGGSVFGHGEFEFVAPHFTVNEDAGFAEITVRRLGGTRSSPALGDMFVDVETRDITATAGLDYIGVTNRLVFPQGETHRKLLIPILQDDEIEEDETVSLELTNFADGLASAGPQPSATLTIVSDDVGLRFEQAEYRVPENIATGVALLSVVRVGSPLNTLSVDYITLTNGTATVGEDYTFAEGTLVFQPGEMTRNFVVPIINDDLMEGFESFEVMLDNPSGAFLFAPSVATVTIIDDDLFPGELGFADVNFAAAEGSGFAEITVIRTNGSTGIISVDYATSDGTATGGLSGSTGVDYITTSGTLVFADGEMSKTFSIPLIDDTIVEGNETVILTLSRATGGTILFQSSAVLTIMEDDVGIMFSAPAYFVGEGQGLATLTVLRQFGSNGVVRVNYTTVDGPEEGGAIGVSQSTADESQGDFGGDYIITAGTLIFADGETSKSISVPILDDSLVEGDEIFFVRLSNVIGDAQLVGTAEAVVTILDNDAGLIFAEAEYMVNEGDTNVVVTVLRTDGGIGAVSVSFATTNGTAVAGSDYVAQSGVLEFLAGETVQTITIPIIDDVLVEGDETFEVFLFNPTDGATLGDPHRTTVTIIDNDAGLFLSSPTYRVSEGAVSVTITVVRTNLFDTEVTVDYTTDDGTATAGFDYFSTAGTLVFEAIEVEEDEEPPTIQTRSFSVFLIDDTIEEGEETILVKLFNARGATLLPPTAAVITIVDNDGPQIVPAGSALIAESILPTNGVIDVNETVTVLFALRNISEDDTVNLQARLLPNNNITAVSAPQSYGVLQSGGHSVSRPFTFTAAGTNGAQITAMLQLQDVIGTVTNNLGVATFTYTLGSTTRSFTNSTAIVLPLNNGPATPYPSTIQVSGIAGTVSGVTATLSNITHSFPRDIDALLVGPAGNRVILMSDAGGLQLVNVTLTFDDAAPGNLPGSGQIVSGAYRPTNYDSNDFFPPPAPPEPYASAMSVFNGTNPNGDWSLFVVDDTDLDPGVINDGWYLTFAAVSTIPGASDLTVTLVAPESPAIVNEEATYTILVTNHGPSTATSVMLTNTLPAGAAFVSASATQGSSSLSGNNVIFNLGAMPLDGVVSATVTIVPGSTAVASTTASVGSTTTDPNTGNNTAALSFAVQTATADIGVTMTDAPDPIGIGAQLVYTVLVTNLGPAAASEVMLTTQLPPEVSFVSATLSQGTHSVQDGVVVCDLGGMASEESATVTIRVLTGAAGTITATASVVSELPDPFKSNNSATVKTVVAVAPLRAAVNGTELTLAWPANAEDYVLESSDSLTEPNWTEFDHAPPQLIDGELICTIEVPIDGSRFFRLRKLTE